MKYVTKHAVGEVRQWFFGHMETLNAVINNLTNNSYKLKHRGS